MFKTLIITLAAPLALVAAGGVILSGTEIAAVLSKATAAAGMKTAPVSTVDQHRINVVNRVSPGTPLAHMGNSEVHYIIDGGGTVVLGGNIVRPAAGAGATIEGGQTRHVAKGDVIFVPAGVAHWYKEVDGAITYLEVRFEEGNH
jgi:mannose-6-phosphate isomerase-like protein (cupin superfamily)